MAQDHGHAEGEYEMGVRQALGDHGDEILPGDGQNLPIGDGDVNEARLPKPRSLFLRRDLQMVALGTLQFH